MPAEAVAKVVHDKISSFTVEPDPFDIAIDNSGGASDGSVYIADLNIGALTSSVLKLTNTGSPVTTITGVGSPAGSFGFLQFSTFAFSGIAIDNSSSVNRGDLYVADIEHAVIDRFSETGAFICQITGKTPVSSEEQKDECNGSAGSQTKAGGFEPTAVVVNSSGELYVADGAHKTLDKFDQTGKYIEEISDTTIINPVELAVDATDSVYVVNGGSPFEGGTSVVKDSGGTFSVLDTSAPRDIAVDPTNGHLYVQDNSEAGGGSGRLEEYSSAGVLLSTFGLGEGHELGTLAVNKVGELYDVAAQSGSITIFGPDITLPTVSVAPATSVEEATATLHGEVSPDATNGGTEVTSCQFEYVTQALFEASTFAEATKVDCTPATPYASAESVTASLTGLVPSTTYYYRVTTANANNRASLSESPAEETFTTTGPPTIQAEATSVITRTAATLEAQVNPDGYDTHYEFQYGETESYGTSIPVPSADIGAGRAPVAVSQQISGLKIGTTYHYRVVATNSRGTALGADRSFITLPAASIDPQLVVAGPHTATIKVRIDPQVGLPPLGGDTSCVFQYVSEAKFATSGYGEATTMPCTPASIEAASEGQNVLMQLTRLSANTVYDYRFLLTNETGEARVEAKLATFGVLPPFESELISQEGTPYTQAGGHPYELTTKVAFNSTTYGSGFAPSSGTLKDVRVQLPLGLVGNPTATGKCTVSAADNQSATRCGPGTQVGVLNVTIENTGANFEGNPVEHVVPLFNVVPPKGVAAELASGEINGGQNATIQAHVRTGEGYGVSADSLNIPTLGLIKKVSVAIWGVPADPGHNALRICPPGEAGTSGKLDGYLAGCGSGEPLKAFLRAPTTCSGGPLTTNLLADSYNAPGEFVEVHAEMAGMENCSLLRFSPNIEVTPETGSADSPTGLHVDLHIPQGESATVLAQADLKDAVVTLPVGMTVNPSSANGLTGCSEAQVELQGSKPAACPNASKIAAVELITPLVDHPLKGGVYVAEQGNAGAAQGSNPFGSLLALYIAIDDPQTGVVVKLAGKVSADPLTGQLTTTFDENPQLPFEDLKLRFFGGPHAALSTPMACGTYTAMASLAPWSGTPPVTPASSFPITSGPNGSSCSSPQPFSPSLTAGSTNIQAGAFTPFATTVSREDGNQDLEAIQVHTPVGLLGMLSSVTPCQEPQAALGTCGPQSEIGHTVVSVGLGSDPYTVVGGKVFITGPYHGAPYGLSIAEPAKAGPFDLGGGPCDCIVVRAKIEVDPHTSALTISSDPLPTILQGIPLQVKHVNVTVDRPGFTFNPTNCSQLAIAGVLHSEQGATASMSVPFHVANCAILPFKPTFSVSTDAKSSKANGADLRVMVTSRPGQANIGAVNVDLPKQLPSRLITLQKACLAAVFEANPASCPAASAVGTATVVTPVLKNPLTGPAYLVSHGGAAFPDLEIVLQGEGITLDLDGKTKIKNGITSSHFNTVPDAPITTFNLVLPRGPHSVLAAFLPARAKGSFCGQKLVMPTTLTGQNGALIKQTTKIAVKGCRKHRKLKKSTKHKRGHGRETNRKK
jgi:hypothetical protein